VFEKKGKTTAMWNWMLLWSSEIYIVFV